MLEAAPINDFAAEHAVDRDVWIGANDLDVEGTFVWADGTPVGAFRPWRTGQPNNAGDQDCVDLDGAATWDDEVCTTAQSWICGALHSSY